MWLKCLTFPPPLKLPRLQLRCLLTSIIFRAISCEPLLYRQSVCSLRYRPSSIGMKKKVELFYFFHINNATTFKNGLKVLAPQITTTTQLLDVATQPNALINIAFSHTGLTALGVNDTLGDTAFSDGQFADAGNLGDPGTANWVQAFNGTNIDGVFLLASDSTNVTDFELQAVQGLFGSSITELHRLQGQVRPGDKEGHERKLAVASVYAIAEVLADFGYMDGISQPGINGFTTQPMPGQTMIDAGHILLGESGDSTSRPSWAKDGSFLVFRQLKQFVPEFDKLLTDNPIMEPGLTPQQGSELLGARMIGRWKSVSCHVIIVQPSHSQIVFLDPRVLQLILPHCSTIPSLQRILNAITTLRMFTLVKIIK
jgi:Dyp-type peroxidase family